MAGEEGLGNLDSALKAIDQFASVRQMRLIAAALVRRLQGCLPDGDEPKRCDDLIESVADAPRPWGKVVRELEGRPGNWRFTHILYATQPAEVARELRRLVAFHVVDADLAGHAFWLIREVVGSPFRRRVDPSPWRTPDVVALCDGLYEQSAFDRLPVVADALEEAGYADSELLSHLRGPGPHVRGCWAVDVVLGKE